MLNNLEVEVLEQLLENDRLQKQLLQELFTALLDDEHGITDEAYQTLCELGDVIGLVFKGSEHVGSCEGRVSLNEEVPEELDRIENEQFIIHIGHAVDDNELWEWAENQDICTIEHLYYDAEEGRIVIDPQFSDQLLDEVLLKLKRDILLKL